jgi:hypothetical protein
MFARTFALDARVDLVVPRHCSEVGLPSEAARKTMLILNCSKCKLIMLNESFVPYTQTYRRKLDSMSLRPWSGNLRNQNYAEHIS